MSVRVLSRVWPLSLPPSDKLVLLRLADTARDDGSSAWRTMARMVEETGLSERTVRRSLRALETVGLIIVTQPADAGRKLATVYQIAVPDNVETGATMTPVQGPPLPPSGDGTGATMTGVGGPLCPNRGATMTPSPYNSPSNISVESASALPAREPAEPDSDLLGTEGPVAESDIAEEMLAIWREELGGTLSVPRSLDADRRKAAKARFKDACGSSFDAWRHACQQVAASPFLTGHGSRGWKATFDWVLRKKNLRRIAEGEFQPDDRAPAGPPSRMDTYARAAHAAEDRDRRRAAGAAWVRSQRGDRMADGFEVFDDIRRHREADHD